MYKSIEYNYMPSGMHLEQGKSMAATTLVILLKLDSNFQFRPVWPWNLMGDLEKQ